MAEAGRIRHHLRNRLWQKSTTVLFVGYQATGSLGNMLQEGARRVKIMGEEVNVAAAIRKLDDYSGHADGPELVQWMKERLPVAKSIFLSPMAKTNRKWPLLKTCAALCPTTASCGHGWTMSST